MKTSSLSRKEFAIAVSAALLVLVPGLFVVKWLVISTFSTKHESALIIYHRNTTEGAEPLHLESSEVEQRLPFFAEGLREARAKGSASIRGDERISAINEFILEKNRRGIQSVYVEFEGSYFSFVMLG